MKRAEAIAELQLRKIADMAQGNYYVAEALDTAIRSMEAWESVREHIENHGYKQDHGNVCGIHVSQAFIDRFIFENEPLDFYVDMDGESE